jgi:hypothetical protein
MKIENASSKYQYALIRYTPDPARGECLNVGLVVRNDREQIVQWNRDFSPSKAFAPLWDKSIMKEWEEYYQEAMTVGSVFSGVEELKLNDDYWNSIRQRCQDQYVLGDACFMLGDEHAIENVAKYLFDKFVLPKNENKRTREGSGWANSFFKKFKFFDNNVYKYPVESKKELVLEGFRFKLPFYQKNGMDRAIWTTMAKSTQDGIITSQGNKYITAKTILSDLWKNNAAFILLVQEYDKENIDIKAAKIAKVDVMPINSADTEKYFVSACERIAS